MTDAARVPPRIIRAGELLQHTSRQRHRGTALHFGNSAGGRYDDPGRSFGVAYLAFDLPTSLMESVFHDHAWARRIKRTITRSEIAQRMVRAVGVLQALRLADLTAPSVMAAALGLNLSQLSSRRYVHTQHASAMLHALRDAGGAPRFDGVHFPSRNNHPSACVALFDRARHKVRVIADIDLDRHRDWPRFVADFRITVLPR